MQRVNSESLSLWALYQKIESLTETEIELVLSTNSPLLENLLALKILRDEAKARGKKINFLLADRSFEYLTAFLNESSAPPPEETGGVIVSKETHSGEPDLQGRAWSWPRLQFPQSRGLFFLVTSIGGLILLISLGFYYLPSAKVSLFLDSEPLTKPIEVSAEPGRDAVSKDPPAIPALEIVASATKSESSPSSGRKEVGEKASGAVTLYNKTNVAANFPAGTMVIKAQVTGDDLRFLTKGAASLPARTADATAVSGYQPGTATVEVTAEKLGEEYNITAGSTLNVGGKPTGEFIAQNNTDLSGGSRRQVVVVTSEDQRKLLEEATNHLKEELKKSVLGKVVTGQIIDDESITYETLGKSFDRSVGDEADRLNLNLEIKASALSFLEGDLKALSGQLLADFVPEGFELFGQERSVEVTQSQAAGGRLKISARAKGFIVPKVDSVEVQKKLVGQNMALAKDYLGSLKNISSFTIERLPDFSFFPLLPFRGEKLKVEITRK